MGPPPRKHLYPPYPGSTSPYTALATAPETITGERDGEHIHHRARGSLADVLVLALKLPFFCDILKMYQENRKDSTVPTDSDSKA